MQNTQVRPRWKERVKDIDTAVDDIRLPENDAVLPQDREWCEVEVDGHRRRIRFHDYDQIFQIPGLYEALFYERLECCSPTRVARLLDDVLTDFTDNAEDLRVLDLGAGNGMMGDELDARGVDAVVGVDIIPEAREATNRDRPDVYGEYHVVDFTVLPDELEKRLRKEGFNCLTAIAALGFGDIPALAFSKAVDLIHTPGWLAFTIKEDFLYEQDSTGFASLVRELNRRQIMQIQAMRRFRHRLSVTGDPLYYVAVIARKIADVPPEILPSERNESCQTASDGISAGDSPSCGFSNGESQGRC